jgi:hypothetical protein
MKRVYNQCCRTNCYRTRSIAPSPSKGYKTVAEQIYGEQGRIKKIILIKKIPNDIHLSRETSRISWDMLLKGSGDGTSANLESSADITSGVRVPLFST